jgi:hypothetical protein
MLQYTKATLKTNLSQWVEGNGAQADDDFVAALDEIIQRGELRLYRDLDLDSLDTLVTTVTVASTEAVAKPANLVAERFVYATVSGRRVMVRKRSRAWVAMFNLTATTGTPMYYAEDSEANWVFSPIPAVIYTVSVHGHFRPASIVDGADGGTTWFSTRVPDLLAGACAIEAAEFLKFWNRKAVAEAEYTAKLDSARGIMANLQRSDIEDMTAGRQNRQTPTQAPDPAATN